VLGATKITLHAATGEPESRRGGSHCSTSRLSRSFDAAPFGARGPLAKSLSPTQQAQFEGQDNVTFPGNGD